MAALLVNGRQPQERSTTAVITTLFQRIHLRDPKDNEAAHLRDLYPQLIEAGSTTPAQDWASLSCYSVLTMMIAQVCGLLPGEFVHTLGDLHIYSNHREQVEEQLSRDIRPGPKMRLNTEISSIHDFKYEDFTLLDYDPHPAIRAPIAV